MPDLDLGPLIKQLRCQKKMTQLNLYDGIVSKSFVSVFEKGEYGIEADKLFNILQRLNVSPDEFLYLRHQFKESDYIRTLQAIDNAYAKKDMLQLDDIFKNSQHRPDLTDKALGALAYLKIAVTGSNIYSMPFENIRFLRDYLNSVEEWTLFELRLFVEGIFVYKDDLPQLKRLFKKAIDTFTKYHQNATLSPFGNPSEHIASIVLNYVQILLYQHTFQHSLYAIIDDTNALLDSFVAKKTLSFAHHLVALYLSENLDKSNQQMLELLNAFKLLEFPEYNTYLQIYKYHYSWATSYQQRLN